MLPEVSYERGYCRPECNNCSQVCPAGAIEPIDVAEKSSIQVGHAVWIKENCIAATKGVPLRQLRASLSGRRDNDDQS